MVAGNMHTLNIAVANNNNAQQNIDNVVSTEKLLKVIPDYDVYILLTPLTSVAAADSDDYLLKANVEVEFLVGKGLDRIALRNESGNVAAVRVAILY